MDPDFLLRRIFREPIPKQCRMDHKCNELCNTLSRSETSVFLHMQEHNEIPYPLPSRLHNEIALIMTQMDMAWPQSAKLISREPSDHADWAQIFESSESVSLIWLSDSDPRLFPVESLEIGGTFVRKGYWLNGIKAFESIHWLATCHSGYTIYSNYNGLKDLFESTICTLQAFHKFEYVAQCVCHDWKPIDKLANRITALQWLNQNVKKQ